MPATRKFAYIDATRGIAVIGVVAVHCLTNFHHILPWRILQIGEAGAFGVQLFFVASALTLLMSARARASTDNRPVLAFYVRRFFRIAPMFYLGALAYGCAHAYIGQAFWDWYDAPRLDVAAMTVLFLHAWTPATLESIVPGGWSIGVEFSFYVMFPLLILLVTDLRRALLFAVFSMVLATLANRLVEIYVEPGKARDVFEYFWLPNNLVAFAFGFITYYAMPKIPKSVAVYRGMIVLLLLLLPLIAWVPLGIVYASFAAFLLINILAMRNPRLLVNPVLQHIGKVSFSVYLTHFGVVAIAVALIGTPPVTGMAAAACYALEILVVLGISVGISTLTYTYVEKPMIAAGNRLLEGQRIAHSGGSIPAPRLPG